MVFDKNWFLKNQQILLWLCNTPIIKIWFRWVLRIRKSDLPLGTKIIKLLPDSFTWFNGVRGERHEFTTDFRTHDKFAKRLYYAFKPFWYLIHGWDLVAPKELNLGFDSLTAYPDAGTGGTTVDGRVDQTYTQGSGVSWATIRAAAGSAAISNSTSTTFWNHRADTTTDNWYQLYRSIFTFNTASLTSNAVISAAVMSLRGTNKTDASSNSPSTDIYLATPASNNNLVSGDFAQIGTTSQTTGAISYASWATTGYNNFTFSATGIGNVSKTGISRFGCRNSEYDAGGATPTWGSNAISSVAGNFADETGTTADPKLVITFTLASAFIPQITFI